MASLGLALACHLTPFRRLATQVGLADLKRAFPPLARGFEQLLEYHDDDFENAFGLYAHPAPPLTPLRSLGRRRHPSLVTTPRHI